MHTRIHTPKHKHTQNVHKTQKSYNIRKSLKSYKQLDVRTQIYAHSRSCEHTHTHILITHMVTYVSLRLRVNTHAQALHVYN